VCVGVADCLPTLTRSPSAVQLVTWGSWSPLQSQRCCFQNTSIVHLFTAPVHRDGPCMCRIHTGVGAFFSRPSQKGKSQVRVASAGAKCGWEGGEHKTLPPAHPTAMAPRHLECFATRMQGGIAGAGALAQAGGLTVSINRAVRPASGRLHCEKSRSIPAGSCNLRSSTTLPSL
jgi:hypothetical protein